MNSNKLKKTSEKAIFVPDMVLPNFLIAEPPAATKGVNLIIGTMHPYPVGWVYQFRNEDDMAMYFANSTDILGKVDGYRIIIKIATTFDNPKGLHNWQQKNILQEMAAFYLESKINPNAGYFKRYKEEN